jgi:hypothetical protein
VTDLQKMIAKERVEREAFLPFQRTHGWSDREKDNEAMKRYRRELQGGRDGDG